MSAAVIFLVIIILIGAAIGGLYFLGLPPFNKTKRAIGQKVKDEDVDEDILREVVLDKILDLEELGETITTEQATEIQDYFDLDDIDMPYVYETLGVTVEDTSASENGTPVTGGPVTDTSASENGTPVTGGPVTDTSASENGTPVTGGGSEVVGYDRTDGVFISVSGGNPIAGEGLYRGDYTQDHTQCTDICDDIPECRAVLIDEEGCRVHQSAVNPETFPGSENFVLYTKRTG